MGLYDTFYNEDDSVSVQLKNGPCTCSTYSVGNWVDLKDGIYVGYEGFVVIEQGSVISVTEDAPRDSGLPVYTKWGDLLAYGDIEGKYPDDILSPSHPLMQGILVARRAAEGEDDDA